MSDLGLTRGQARLMVWLTVATLITIIGVVGFGFYIQATGRVVGHNEMDARLINIERQVATLTCVVTLPEVTPDALTACRGTDAP